MTDQFFTVSELNKFIRDVLTSGFPSGVWVCGEIQGFDRNRDKKHVFFELCEKDAASQEITARIGLVIFANRRDFIESILKKSENAFALKDDIEVKFLCKVDFYAPHGAVRLVVESIDPVYTLGKIAQDRQRLIALLKKSGALDKNKQLVLPDVPLQIGLITSHDSAAYNDFVDELKRSGIGFKIFLVNSMMQGKNTETSICKAIKTLNTIGNLDAIVITRGGGSIAELSCFDSQAIVEAVAASVKPVLSGIGHEINTTVTDLAAHTFAKTPTAIAQFLINRVENFLTALEDRRVTIFDLARDKIGHEKTNLKSWAHRLQTQITALVKSQHQLMTRLTEGIKHRPFLFLRDGRQELTNEHQRFLETIRLHLKVQNTKMGNYQKLIDVASPLNTLRRGFTITRRKNGNVLKNMSSVHKGDALITEFADGQLVSEVQHVTKENKSG